MSAKNELLPTTDDSPESTLERFHELRIQSDTDVPEIIPIVKIGEATICTPENITVISGESKSSKSAFANVIIAGAIYQNELNAESFQYLTIKYNSEHHAVLHFDTEQSRTIHKRRYQGILNRAGLANQDPEYFYSYNIRKLDIKEYKEVTRAIIDAASQKHGGVHMVIVDGIADYILSVNDEEEANEIVHFFEQISVEYQCTVLTIIHLNPGSETKQRGHLGSQLQRKAESVLVVRKDKNTGISWIEPQFLRNAGNENVPQLQFRYDHEKQYHVFAGVKYDEQANAMQKLRNLANDLFLKKPEMTAKEIIPLIVELTGYGIRKAKSILNDLVELELVEMEGGRGKYTIYRQPKTV